MTALPDQQTKSAAMSTPSDELPFHLTPPDLGSIGKESLFSG